MPKVLLFLCAETVIRDAETNTISIIHVVEEVQSETLPILLPRLVILAVYERGEGDPESLQTQYKITLGSTTMLDQVFPASFGDRLRTRHILQAGGLPVVQPGILDVSVSIGNV